MLSILHHQGLPKVIDIFIEKELSTGKPLHYLVMEFIEGKDLETIIQERGQKSFPVDEAVDYFRQILNILHYLHTQNPPIVHRDLNPRNVMVHKGKVFLVDFGIARLFNPQQKGTAIGTAGYAAPEQYKGAAEPRSDIFSLGAVMHYLVTGKDPEDASGSLFSFEQARKINPSVPKYLDTLIMSMVDVVIDKRPCNTEALIKALDGKQQTSFFGALGAAAGKAVAAIGAISPAPPKAVPPSSSPSGSAAVAAIGATSPAPLKAVPPSSTLSQSIEELVNTKDGAEMVLIPAGAFLMGSPWDLGSDDEHPQHSVYLDAYYISKYQVTNEQFAQFVRETGYRAKGDWENYAEFGKEKHPVVDVTWYDAMAYCDWAGGSLPTEAQWEKAARGTDGRQYPWGNNWDELGKCNWRKGPKAAGMADIYNKRGTTPVGTFRSDTSSYGIHDMAGNVWEWCSDSYGKYYYKSSPSRNPEGPAGVEECVIRGGSWYYADSNLFRCAIRSYNLPSYSSSNGGFRVCYSNNDGKQQMSAQSVQHPQAPSSGNLITPTTVVKETPPVVVVMGAVSPAPPKAAAPSPSPAHSVKKVIAKECAEIVLIPAGEFLMGSLRGQGSDDECPQHNVYLDAYYISKYQVTNEQFDQFVRETGYGEEGDWKKYAKAGKEKHPVVCVNWNDAMAYCRWAGGSLPTEGEHPQKDAKAK
jgi:formylglycine-generating enzyme required for sulfatase activity